MNAILKTSMALLIIVSACKSKKDNKQVNEIATISYSVQRSLPHDLKAFTQGLTIHRGELYESTGQNGSWIGVVDIKTGIANKKVTLSNNYFGEGITILNNKVYQLTWQDSVGFVYDLQTFKKIKDFTYQTEGWGITHNNIELIMSDGSNHLYFLDSTNLSVTKKIKVNYNGKPVDNLNELEYVEGYIYANIWQTNLIAKINPETGEVLGFLDLSKLAAQAQLVNPSMDVLNGIAWHEATKSLLITGKYWPFIYILKLENSEDNV